MLKKIEDYQLRELKENKLFINIYDLSLKYNYELNIYWKELFFDIICALDKINKSITAANLFIYFKEHYLEIIKRNNLNIDLRDYVEINDYISYEEWIKNPDHGIAYFSHEIYLITK